MNKVYKIIPSLVNKLVYRDIRKSAYIMMGTILFYYLTTTYGNHKRNLNNNAINFSIIFTIILFGLLLLAMIKTKKLFYSNYEISVSDLGVYKLVNYDNGENIGFFSKLILAKVNRITPQYNIALKWQDIITIKEKYNGLNLKISNASTFFGSGLIIIPREIEDYDELKKLIQAKIAKTLT